MSGNAERRNTALFPDSEEIPVSADYAATSVPKTDRASRSHQVLINQTLRLIKRLESVIFISVSESRFQIQAVNT
jgi:hypothetical protein